MTNEAILGKSDAENPHVCAFATPRLLLACALLGTCCAFGETIPQGADLATMHDYYYYAGQSGNDRATHTIMYGGTYTLSENKVWSSLCIGQTIEEPVVLDLCGNTLTLTGCDAAKTPFEGYDNTTVVISNGTLQTVYDTNTYQRTIAYTRGVVITRNDASAVGGSRLVIAKDGFLTVENGLSSTVRCAAGASNCTNNSLVVEDGGTLNARLWFYGNDNRYVFKKGSTFSQISQYVYGGQFPVNIGFDNVTNNVIEICDSKILTDAGVTKLLPESYAKSTSFHSGLCLRSSDVDFTATDLKHGDRSAALLEIKDGARLSISGGQVNLGTAPVGSGTLLSIDGVGSAVQVLSSNNDAGGVGWETNTTDVVLRLTNGAAFDASGKTFYVGRYAGSNSNLVEVLSESHFASGSLVIGISSNYCNRVVVSGEGTTMTNTYISLGPSSPLSGGGHSLTVTDHADAIVTTRQIYVGYKSSGGCLLEVSDFAKLSVTNGSVIMGDSTDMARSCSNRVVVCNGGSLEVKSSIEAVGNYSQLVVSNGTVSAGGLFINAANVLVQVAGPYAFLEFADANIGNPKFRVDVPAEGFQDREGNARAPLSFPNGFTWIGGTTTFEVDASKLRKIETPILHIPGGIPDKVFSKVTLIGERCKLVRSGDTLSVLRTQGFALFVR